MTSGVSGGVGGPVEEARSLEDALLGAVDWLQGLVRGGGPNLITNARRKLVHEAGEFRDHPSFEEAADILICLAGSLSKYGWDVRELAAAVDAKVQVNRERTWKREADGTWQHVSTGPSSVPAEKEQGE